MPPKEDIPSAVYVQCPDCAEETLHTVLKGTVGTRGGYVLDATVSCSECGRVHHAQVREAPEREVPVVVSSQEASERASITMTADEQVKVGDLLVVGGRNVLVTSIELPGTRRVESAPVSDVVTLWAKDYESVVVKFAVNLGHKTITNQLPARPEQEFHVGDEHVFGRLRVTVHSIKTKEKLLRRGSAPAGEIVRVFAKPTPPERKSYRPEKPIRDRMRAAQAEDESRAEGRSARFGARRARQTRERDARRRPAAAPSTETEDEEDEL